MFVRIDARDPKPIYQQVADSIRVLIAGGQLTAGMALPPVRQLAADLGTSQNTIALAYRELQDEGLADIRHGSGAVIARRSRDTVWPGADDRRADLRKQLRGLLAQLLLSGLKRKEVLRAVGEELEGLGQ